MAIITASCSSAGSASNQTSMTDLGAGLTGATASRSLRLTVFYCLPDRLGVMFSCGGRAPSRERLLRPQSHEDEGLRGLLRGLQHTRHGDGLALCRWRGSNPRGRREASTHSPDTSSGSPHLYSHGRTGSWDLGRLATRFPLWGSMVAAGVEPATWGALKRRTPPLYLLELRHLWTVWELHPRLPTEAAGVWYPTP